jgi:DNA-binding response OmpR family regulator
MLDFDDGLAQTASLKVLIIEDDEELAQALAEALEHAGMRAACAATGASALTLKQSFMPDIALVDHNLPDTDGPALLTLLVRQGDCGLIIVSGMTEESDRIIGLELGADDYICKPPHPRELLARIRAVHRRVKLRAAVSPDPAGRPLLQLGRMTVDLRGRTVRSATGETIRLTSAEFTALEILLAADGEPVSRDSLSEAALRHPWRAEDRGVDQLIFSLRQKLAAGGDQPLIHSIRGAGYSLSVSLNPVAVPVAGMTALAAAALG